MNVGATANDTVIGDPLMTVPINAPEFGDDLNLCYEIHGAADKYFNLVSDGCTSVNAHYVKPSGDVDINFIDSISVVAVDNNNACHEISVNASSCSPVVNGNVGMVMNGNGDPAKRKRHVKIHLEEAGVSVRSDHSWVRISVPNCADNSLVMWVFCHNQRLYDYSTNKMTEPVDMIKFEITRGLNLRETSHGLLGNFSNQFFIMSILNILPLSL